MRHPLVSLSPKVSAYVAAGGAAGGGLPVFLQTATDAADATSYTFSSQNIGKASANRQIIVCTATRSVVSGVVSAVSVGGVSATELVTANFSVGQTYSSIWMATVPSGTTADVVVTTTATIASSTRECGCAVALSIS